MAFCTQCGNSVAHDARFCPKCGSTMSGGDSIIPVTAATLVEPLEYKIEGDNLQIARIRLKAGQDLFAEAGKMVYKTPSVEWDSRMTGATIGDKIWGAIKRKIAGESLFFTHFRTNTVGEVGFAGSYPGRIMAFDLKPGQSLFCQRDGFLFAQSSVT